MLAPLFLALSLIAAPVCGDKHSFTELQTAVHKHNGIIVELTPAQRITFLRNFNAAPPQSDAEPERVLIVRGVLTVKDKKGKVVPVPLLVFVTKGCIDAIAPVPELTLQQLMTQGSGT
jgi:hypothetical protein